MDDKLISIWGRNPEEKELLAKYLLQRILDREAAESGSSVDIIIIIITIILIIIIIRQLGRQLDITVLFLIFIILIPLIIMIMVAISVIGCSVDISFLFLLLIIISLLLLIFMIVVAKNGSLFSSLSTFAGCVPRVWRWRRGGGDLSIRRFTGSVGHLLRHTQLIIHILILIFLV